MARTEILCSLVPSFESIVRLRLREVRPRKSLRSGTGLWHPAWKLVKSRPMGSPSQDRDAGSRPVSLRSERLEPRSPGNLRIFEGNSGEARERIIGPSSWMKTAVLMQP